MANRRLKQELGQLLLPLLRLVPYGTGACVLKWVCRQRWVRSLFFGKGMRLLGEFLPLADPGLDLEQVQQRSVAANFLGSWRLAILTAAEPATFDKWVTVIGLDCVRDHHSDEHGLILVNCHYGMPRMAPVTLARLGYSVLALEAADLFARLGIQLRDNLTVMEVASKRDKPLVREVYRAKRALDAGSVIHIAADGSFGSSGIELSLHGRRRPFAAGFAELAIMTGARVLPVFTNIAVDGVVSVEFLGPLDPGSETMGRKEKVEHLITQYVDHVERRYIADPGNVRWIHFRRFFSGMARGGLSAEA